MRLGIRNKGARARDYAQKVSSLLSEHDVINRCNYATYMSASHLLTGNIREAFGLLNEVLLKTDFD